MTTELPQMIARLQNVKGSIAKKRVIEDFRDSAEFRNALYYALNPRLTYKISEKTLMEPVDYDPSITLVYTDLFDICDSLSHRKALDDATVYQVKAFIQCLDQKQRELAVKLLSKTLRLGVTAKTVNQIIPGLIPEWNIQQAYPIEKYQIPDGEWFSLTQKLNGVRATYYNGQLYARSGDIYTGLDHFSLNTIRIK